MSEPLSASPALDEEVARAELYGLLAALYYAPPSAELLARLRVAVTEAPAAGGFLEAPWRALVGAARAQDDAAVAAEYEALFGGVGKPEVYLYGSHYLSGFLNEKPLARLRADLAALGLTRDEAMPETEDHIAYLCEVMRYLIAGDGPPLASDSPPGGQRSVGAHSSAGDGPPLASDSPPGGQRSVGAHSSASKDAALAKLAQQQKFFSTHVQPWLGALCAAIAAHPRARFYAALAGFTQAFVGVETQGFDLLA
ncbi:molecular chaperone TorD family protein [Ramlibacter sp. 2FC]|uniref:TorD/DmsD family molecular chaperone n=1 Tax=Ramlibacter sp. 2FC TaxID=2502188 RepID=UPI00201E6A9D|nr:molecular chaperone TorD family protein [Ramlibacter sp. 2FC]